MVINYKKFSDVKFPVYILPSSNWEEIDGLLYVDNKLVDDKNMSGKTIGMRRLQTPMKNILPLKRSISSSLGIIKQDRISSFIDTEGTPFIYEKTT